MPFPFKAASNLTHNLILTLGPKPSLLVQLAQLLDNFDNWNHNKSKSDLLDMVYAYLDDKSDSLSFDEKLELCISLAGLKADSNSLSDSIDVYSKGLESITLQKKQTVSPFSTKSIELIDVLN